MDVWKAIISTYESEEVDVGLSFESHRSLLLKMQDQLDHNYQYSYRRIKEYASRNIFDRDTVISKYRPVRWRIERLRSLSGNNDDTKREMRKLINQISKFLFQNYSYGSLLNGELFEILRKNSPLRSRDISNLNFIVNALLVELYYAGYDLDFIKNIPELILMRLGPDKFPWGIELEGLDELSKEQYINKQCQNFSLHTVIKGIQNLLDSEQENGYVVFRINGVELIEPEEIVVDRITFYNPQRIKKMKLGKWNEDEAMKKVELFQFLPDKFKDVLPSTCNAIYPIKFRAIEKERRSIDLHRAYREINRALPWLEHISSKYSKHRKISPSIQLEQKILLKQDFSPPEVGLAGLVPIEKKVLISKDEDKEEFYFSKEFYIDNLNTEITYQKHLLDLYFELRRQQNHEWLQGYGELWSIWEVLFVQGTAEEKKQRLTEIHVKCYRKYLEERYISRTLQGLRWNLKESQMFSGEHYHYFGSRILNKIGLGEKLSKIRFNRYIDDALPNSPLLFRLKAEAIKLFETDKARFYLQVDQWIENTVNEVYLARNLHFHSKHENEFVTIRLKKDYIKLSLVSLMMILRLVKKNRRIRSFSKVVERL
ncbi:hypothetical protein [Lewinella cohaerens]|uniref:hypothetical protein n=1 Tax=Lewinella cohaerens TaxID=70995 RepID=UPI0012EC17FB|nr:hypothetical protein [Lewinella cohaerens]